MRLHSAATLCTLALGMLVLPPVLPAQDQSGAAMDEMMKRWQAVMTPGPQHKILASLEGTWDAEITMWQGGQGSAPTTAKGTSVRKMILGGRYLQEDITSEMMGMPFQGSGLTGFDNMDKKLVGTWVDNFGTGIALMEGFVDQKGTVLTLLGKMDEPMTGEHDKYSKYVTRILNKDKTVFEVHDLTIGEPNTKVMEIVYTRRK